MCCTTHELPSNISISVLGIDIDSQPEGTGMLHCWLLDLNYDPHGMGGCDCLIGTF